MKKKNRFRQFNEKNRGPNQLIKKKKWYEKPIYILVTLATILGIIPTLYFIYDRHIKSDKQKFNEERIISGKLNPPLISKNLYLETKPNLAINYKTYKYPILKGIHIDSLQKRELLSISVGGKLLITQVPYLYNGLNILHQEITGCNDFMLGLVAYDDRIYISVKILDFRTENLIGEINYNKWAIYKEDVLDYRENDTSFEIKDKQGNIALSLAFVEDKTLPFLNITGYVINSKSVLILKNDYFAKNKFTPGFDTTFCIPKNESDWKNKAFDYIKNIKSVF